MTDSKEIQLLIRASLKGGRDLDSITKSIGELEKAIESQADAAKRGESSFEALRVSAAALKAVQDELGARGNAIRSFEALTKRIDDQSNAVERARKKLEAFEAANAGDRTAKQQEKVQKLTASYQAASARLDEYRRSSELLDTALRETGVDTKNLGDQQSRLADQQVLVAAAQKRITKELLDYNENVRKGREAVQAKVKADRDAATAADLFAAAEKRAADATRARAKAGEEFDSRRGDRRSQVAGDARQAQEEAAALARAREMAALRADIEQRSAQGIRDAGLQKIGDDAEVAARQFKTLTRASTDLRPKIISLRETVDSLINPAAKSRETLDGVEKEIKDLAAVIGGSQGPIKDYAEQFRSLQAAQKAIQGQAGLVDDFRKQAVALREARTEMVAARTQVLQYAAAVRQGGEAGAQFTKPLAEAQIRLRAASVALRDQANATREARDALRRAGIDTRNLADAEDRLVTATKAATTAMRDLGDAAEKNGHAVARSGKAFSLFNDEGRTTLSLAQRIRGEILALLAAYVGVQGAIGLAASSLKAFSQAQGLRSTLSFALGGDAAQVANEIKFVRDETERLGIAFEQGSKGYAKFAASAIRSGASVQETRFIFQAFSEVARVINLTPDELNGLFNAIGQSFSKGKIQAEELRQQIGERLPAAFAIAQAALKDIFPNLDKALEQGLVGAEHMLTIAESVRRAAQGELPTAIQALDAQQQRFNNSVLFFKEQIAKAGFADAYVALLKQITTFFKSTEGEEFAKTLGSIAVAFTQGLSALITYREELKAFGIVLIGLIGAKIFVSIATGIATLTTSMAAAKVAAAALPPVIGLLVAALRLLAASVGAFFVGFAFGDWLRAQSRDVRIFGIAIVVGFAELWSKVKFGALELWETMPQIVADGLKQMINRATENFRKFLLIFQVGAKALGLDSVASSIGSALDLLTFKVADGVKNRAAEIRKQAEADLKRIREIGEGLIADQVPIDLTQKSVRDRSDSRFFRDRPLVPRTGAPPPADKKGAKEIESIEKALDALQARALKKQGETLSSLLEAIDVETQELGARIAKIGGARGREFAERFRAGIALLKFEVIKDFTDKIFAEQEALQNKLDALDASAGRKNKDDLDARVNAVRQANEKIFREIEDYRKRLQDAGLDTAFADIAKRRAEAAVLELQNLERVKVLKEQLTKEEEKVNLLVKARDISIKRAQEQVVSQELTPGQGDEKILGLIEQAQPGINAAAEAARIFTEANRQAFDPEKVEEFLLKLEQVRNSGAALNAEFDKTAGIINAGISSGIDNAFDSLFETINKVAEGTANWGDVFQAAGRSILMTIANVLKELALLVLKEQLLIQIQLIRIALSGGGGGVASAGTGTAVPVGHVGMLVGRSSPSRTRNVDAAWFANAPRYHAGGVVGMAPNEVAVIAEKNEEILSASDPRNAMNGGGQATAAQDKAMRFVLVDERSRIPEAMSGPEGEAVTLVHLKKNIPTLRQLLR